MDRRTVLASAAATTTAAVSGCLAGFQDDEEPSHHLEVAVQNDHDRAYDVEVELTDADDAVVLERSFTLESGEGRGFADDVPGGEYVLTVDVVDRTLMRSYWNTDRCAVQLARIDVADDGHVSQHVTCRNSVEGPGPFGDVED